MVRIGIVGLGFMGRIHYLGWKGVAGARLGAVCSRDRAKLRGDWRGVRGNFGPPGEQVDLAGVNAYESLDALLADPSIDLVDICNPTHLHAEYAIAALTAGKHVLVEKAIALTTQEADAMVQAAQKHQRLLMVAHVLPFFPEFAFAAEAARSQRYGKLLGGHLRRVISRPDWSGDIADAAKTGGPAVDLHIHDTHFIGLLAGVPRAVRSTGVVEQGVVQYVSTQYLYPAGGPAISCVSGAVAMSGRPFAHGFELYFERATLTHDSSGTPLTVFTADGAGETPALAGGGDPIAAFTAELAVAAGAVSTGQTPALLSGTLARDALVMCHRECESVLSGREVPVG